jgi:hypothetical protein
VPVWHVSVSLWQGAKKPVRDERRMERLAVRALEGVGGESEWWVLRDN